jgi:uncharacterized protein (DUF983 family)
MPRHGVGLGTFLRRALTRRCPACGIGKPFEGWWRLAPECPHCAYHYEREEGYWVGSMVVATAVTEGIFGIFLVGVLIATLPDVDVIPVLVVGILINLIVPVFFYPLAKTIWVAIDIYFNRPSGLSSV